MLKVMITAAALAFAATGPVLAQSAGFVSKQNVSELRCSKLVGTNVYGPNDEKIGDVNEVLIDNGGSVHAVVIGVGGFLGVGEKDVAVPFKSLNIKHAKDSDKIDRISVRYTKDQLKQAPSFAYYGASNDRNTGSSSNRSDTGTSDTRARGSAPAGTGTAQEPYTTPANPAPKR
jgi:sporulation protein YlmC with PRC-barrel domain